MPDVAALILELSSKTVNAIKKHPSVWRISKHWGVVHSGAVERTQRALLGSCALIS